MQPFDTFIINVDGLTHLTKIMERVQSVLGREVDVHRYVIENYVPSTMALLANGYDIVGVWDFKTNKVSEFKRKADGSLRMA